MALYLFNAYDVNQKWNLISMDKMAHIFKPLIYNFSNFSEYWAQKMILQKKIGRERRAVKFYVNSV